MYLALQTTMPQRSLSVYFSSPVQPSSRAKREDVIDALLYFRLNYRTTSSEKRQEAYNEAQKACATLFLSVPMATLCEFVPVAQKMATRDREVCCLQYEFYAMHAGNCLRMRGSTAATRTEPLGSCVFFVLYSSHSPALP